MTREDSYKLDGACYIPTAHKVSKTELIKTRIKVLEHRLSSLEMHNYNGNNNRVIKEVKENIEFLNDLL